MRWLKRLFGGKPDSSKTSEATAAVAPTVAPVENSVAAAQMGPQPDQGPEFPLLAALEAETATETGTSAADLAAELEALAADLFYIGESDDTFSGATLDGVEGATGAATAEEVRAALGLEPEAAVSILDAHDFFWEYYTDASIHGEAEAARFQALHDRMVEGLTEIRFVKTDGAEDWEKIIHLIGRHESGALVGLTSTGVET